MSDPTSDTVTHSHGHVHDQLAYECGEDFGPWVEHTHDASPQPDTAPEGPWTVSGDAHNVVLRDDGAEVICHDAYGTDDAADGDLALRVAAALNGAPATPAEKAVIDAAEDWYVDQRTGDSMALAARVAKLLAERNQNDG